MRKEISNRIVKSKKSLIINGDIASGKTKNVCFPIVDELIENAESLFILDSKEEYINKYYDKLKDNDYNIIILNLRDLEHSENWNPLDYPYSLYKKGKKDEAQEYIEKIAKIMFYEKASIDPFWSLTASDFFTGTTLGLFEDGNKEEINISSINNIFNVTGTKHGEFDYVKRYFELKPKTSVPYIFASSTFLAPVETKGSILSVARQKLRLYISREKLSKLLGITSFSINDILTKKTAIIVINRDDNKALSPLITMFIEQLYNILLDNKIEFNYNFILDNFDLIEKINDFSEMIGASVSRNVKFIIVTRYLDELANNYNKYLIKLCNHIFVKDDKLEISVNYKSYLEENDEYPTDIKNGNVEFPKLIEKELVIFDYRKFVIEKKAKIFEEEQKIEEEHEIAFNKMLESIDRKIKGLDEKLKEDISENHMDL